MAMADSDFPLFTAFKMSSATADEAKRTLKGGCHCGFIKYTITVPESRLTENPAAGRCNCTICLKQGFTSFRLPQSDFNLLSPSSLSECKDYRPRGESGPDIHKYFCGTCGVHVVGAGKFPWKGQLLEFFQINVVTLDQPQEGLDLSKWKMIYVDGRNDRFEKVSTEGPWAGGAL